MAKAPDDPPAHAHDAVLPDDDAAIAPAALRRRWSKGRAQLTPLSIDGDTSTNDTLLLLANGAFGSISSARTQALVFQKC